MLAQVESKKCLNSVKGFTFFHMFEKENKNSVVKKKCLLIFTYYINLSKNWKF
jgi:hypothetical protein